VGYLPVDAPAYDLIRFDLVDTRIFLIDRNFPRIAPETLSDASYLDHITNLRYTLDLTDHSAFTERLLTLQELLPSLAGNSR
jgi:hypothetical protein